MFSPAEEEHMAKTGEKYALVMDSKDIAVSAETLTYMAGLLDWATTFKGSQQLQHPDPIYGPMERLRPLHSSGVFFQDKRIPPFRYVYTETHGTGPCVSQGGYTRGEKRYRYA